MNLREFMNEYADDLMSEFPNQLNLLLLKHEYESSVRDERVRILPHPFSRGHQSLVIEDRNGTSIHRLTDWQNDSNLRLQVVTGEHYDPNQVWKQTLRFFLEHEEFGKKFPTWAWDMGTNFRKGSVSVCCPDLTTELQERLTNVLARKGYHCTFVVLRTSSYLRWEARKQVNLQQVSVFLEELEHILRGIRVYTPPRLSLFQRVLSLFG